MIYFIIHFNESSHVNSFLSAISEEYFVTEYSVKDCGTLLTISFDCKSYFAALVLVRSVETILKNLKFGVRPYTFSFSQYID